MFNKFVSISFSIAFGVAPVIMYKQKSIYHRSFSFLSYLLFFFLINKALSNYLLSGPPRRSTHFMNSLWRFGVHLIRFLSVGAGLDDALWQTCLEITKKKSIKFHVYMCVWVEILEWNTKDYFETLICIWRKRKLPPDKGSTVNTKKHVLVMWKTIASTCIVAWNIWLIRRRI